MQHDGDVLAGFDHFVEITDAARTHRARQRSVEPLRVATFQQVAAGEIGCGEVVMAGDRPKRKPKAGSHVRHKSGFAATCRPLEQQWQLQPVGGLEYADLIAGRAVIGDGSGRLCLDLGHGVHRVILETN